jgi:hypothetical protein
MREPDLYLLPVRRWYRFATPRAAAAGIRWPEWGVERVLRAPKPPGAAPRLAVRTGSPTG